MPYEYNYVIPDTLDTYGRHEISVPIETEELTPEIVKLVLEYALPLHFKNIQEILYLRDYYKGKQDILLKEKLVREEINNKVTENNAFYIVEFKKGYVFGDPIQYVSRADTSPEELNILNGYMLENGKSEQDTGIAEDMYIVGQGYRMVMPNNEEDKPFAIHQLEALNTFVVYSSNIAHDKLMGCYIMNKLDDTMEVMCYTKNMIYYFSFPKQKTVSSGKSFDGIVFKNVVSNPLKEIPIFEYTLNKSRLGLIELVKSLMDSLNKITSADIDDIEQWVQSLLVFYNQNVTEQSFGAMTQMGALTLFTVDPAKPADVKLIGQKMEHSQTKVLFERLYNDMLVIVGVPRISDKVSGGDTGQAKLLGEGWTLADQRAKQDESAFKKGEKDMLKLVLKICKSKGKSGIKTLTSRDIEIKFTRNKSDNMLTKAQTLSIMKSSQVDPEVAFSTIEMFSDPAEVFKKSKAYYGDNFWKEEEKQVEENSDQKTEMDNANEK